MQKMFTTYIDDVVRHTELNLGTPISRGVLGNVDSLNEADKQSGEYGWCAN